MNPGDLENLIECYRLAGTFEEDRERQQAAFARMRELISMRSPATVARMEDERKLRAPL